MESSFPPRTPLAAPLTLAVAMALVACSPALAQRVPDTSGRDRAGQEVAWPVPFAPPTIGSTSRATGRSATTPSASFQEALLPVLDNQGRVIPRSLIEARIDRSGAAGMVLGGLGGMIVGGLMGAALASMVDCGQETGLFGWYENCSPQEDALRAAWGIGSIATGLVGGGYLGWERDRTTWWEALSEIRRERTLRPTGGGRS